MDMRSFICYADSHAGDSAFALWQSVKFTPEIKNKGVRTNRTWIYIICSSGSLLPELLGEPDENSFGAPDVTEPIRAFVQSFSMQA
jgi:hypothetical protein